MSNGRLLCTTQGFRVSHQNLQHEPKDIVYNGGMKANPKECIMELWYYYMVYLSMYPISSRRDDEKRRKKRRWESKEEVNQNDTRDSAFLINHLPVFRFITYR